MLVLLCAVTIGQMEDVATLRDRYEKAQASYELLQKSYVRMHAVYEDLGRPEPTKSKIDAFPANSTDPKMLALHKRLAEQQMKFARLRAQHRRMLALHLRQLEALLLQSKQKIELLKWQYEQAAGRVRGHWA